MRMTTLFLLLAGLALSSAFAPMTSSWAVSQRTAVVTEASRTNAKKDKRQRNRDNMRKFQKPAPRFGRGKESQQSSALLAKRAAAKEKEAEFVAKLFQFVPFSEEQEKIL